MEAFLTADSHNDPWLDLIGRFHARGAQIKVGNIQPCMIKHLLDSVEEMEVNVRAVEDRLRKLTGVQAATEPPPEPRIDQIKPDNEN